MIMKFTVLLTSVLVIHAVHAQTNYTATFDGSTSRDSLVISGEIPGLQEDELVILFKYYHPFVATSWKGIDTALVKSGKFVLRDQLNDGPRLLMIHFPAHQKAATIILGNEKVKMTSTWNINDVPSSILNMYLRYEGSDLANDFLYTRAVKTFWLNSLSQIDQAINQFADSVSLSKTSLERLCCLIEVKSILSSSVKMQFSSTDFGKRDAAICEAYTESFYYDQKFDSLWLSVYKNLDEDSKKTYYGKILAEYIPLLKGQPAPDFPFVNSPGRTARLRQVTGANKLTLLRFWSYDVPEERLKKVHDELAKVYKRYHPKGLEMVNVSLDANLKKWKKTVEEDKIPGLHSCDLEEEEGEAAKLYKIIKKDYYDVLIDQQGKIVAWEVYGPELMAYLYRTFKE